VRFAWGSGEDNALKTYYRDDDRSDWKLLNDEAVAELQLVPLGFSADGRTAYLEQEQKNGPNAVVAYDSASHAMHEQLRDAIADATSTGEFAARDHLVFGPKGELLGLRLLDARPRTVFFDENDPTAKLYRMLEKSFPDSALTITDYTRDGGMALINVYGDTQPGDVYLFDLDSKKAVHMVSHRDWIDPERMGAVRPIRFAARDGLAIEGFLTTPAGSDGRNLPLVVYPHGGPIGIRDEWRFDQDAQLLASRGYAVLQVNFRGSGGRGRAFRRAGFRQWGGAMQDDVTDATKWAIAQHIADPHRICIYGSSYGGYAALMGVAKEPDLYRCAIGYVGVYDLPRLYGNEPMQSRSRTNSMEAILGSENLEALSPVHLADRIKVPVMLVAGAEDEIAVPAHTEMMRDALLKAGKQVDAKIYPGEGHGFFVEANREDFYARMLDFLQKNIGGGGAPPEAPARK
jgi:dipeptidyl aminopeptidase/acylaminoacyl peptidase